MAPQQALVRSQPICPEMTRTLSCDRTIDSLPTELLQMIFRYAAFISTPEPENQFSHSRHRFTIIASHVSWRWRRVALGDPFLWSCIPVATSHPDSVEYFQAFIERSHTHRLAIHIRHNVSQEYQQRLNLILDSLQSQGGRLGELSMIGCEGMRDTLQEKLMFAAPMLETLKLLVGSQMMLPIWSPSDIFCGNVPRLRHIKLVGWSNWNPPYNLFRDISHLTFSFHGVAYVPLFPLFELLGHCSRLKHLELKFVFPAPTESLKVVIPINLTHLRTLLLDRCDSRSILSCLKIPPKVNVTVWEDPEGPYFMRMPEDCSQLHNLDDITVVRLVVNADDMTLTAHNHRNGSFFEWSQVSYLDSIDGEYDDIIISSFGDLFHSSLSQFTPFYGIREFSVDCAFEPTLFTRSVPWDAVFQSWTALNTLTLCNYPVEEVIQALTPSIRNMDAVFCPQLETLQLQIPEANVAMFNILMNLFRQRERRGFRIKTLRLKLTRDDYRTYREEIAALKDCVQNVQIQRL